MTFSQPLHFRCASGILLVPACLGLLGHSFHLIHLCPDDKDGIAMADKIVGIGPYQYVHILDAVSDGESVLQSPVASCPAYIATYVRTYMVMGNHRASRPMMS